MRTVMALVLSIFLLIIASSSASASCNLIAQQDIDHGPYLINSSGRYCLVEDIHVNYQWKNQHGFKTIDVQARNVNIDLGGYALINDDGSSYLRSNFSQELQAIDVWGYSAGATSTGSELIVKNGKIIGFDFGIKDTSLRGTGKLVVENVYFENVYLSIWARPVKAWVRRNQFVNTKPFQSSAIGISLQETDTQVIEHNLFFNHHTALDLFGSKTVNLGYNKISSPWVQFPVAARGITITNVLDANIHHNRLSDLYIGLMANLRSDVSAVKNTGCRLNYPVLINSPARLGEVGNDWNRC